MFIDKIPPKHLKVVTPQNQIWHGKFSCISEVVLAKMPFRYVHLQNFAEHRPSKLFHRTIIRVNLYWHCFRLFGDLQYYIYHMIFCPQGHSQECDIDNFFYVCWIFWLSFHWAAEISAYCPSNRVCEPHVLHRIDVMVAAARARQDFTHFVSLPINSPDIQAAFHQFKAQVLSREFR
jgi:hypothetical protein